MMFSEIPIFREKELMLLDLREKRRLIFSSSPLIVSRGIFYSSLQDVVISRYI